jgi:hypothetical protein
LFLLPPPTHDLKKGNSLFSRCDASKNIFAHMTLNHHHHHPSAARRFHSSSIGHAIHIEVSAEWVLPLHQHRHESMVRAAAGGADVVAAGTHRSTNSFHTDASSPPHPVTTSAAAVRRVAGGGTVPLYFTGSVDEWHRIEALLPFMVHLVSDVSTTAGGLGGTARMGIEHAGRRQFDVVIGPHKGGAVLVHFTQLLREGVRNLMHHRISSLGAAGQSLSAHFLSSCLVLVDVEEPQQDILSWINLTCLEHRVTLQLCWSWQDVKSAICGINEGGGGDGYSGGSHHQSVGGRGAQVSAVQTMMTALSQTPALMSKQDVIRAANKVNTVAELLLLTEASLSGLPGIGPRKAKRIEAVFHAPFPTTEARLEDVWLAQSAENEIDDRGPLVPARPAVQETTLEAPESARSDENASSTSMPTLVPAPHAMASHDAPAADAPTPRRVPNASTAFKEALNRMLQAELEDADVDE